MKHADQLLRLLALGEFLSGEHLASELGVSRTAVWKKLKKLQADYGLEIHAVKGRGYRLANPLDLLDEAKVWESAGEQIEQCIINSC